MEAWVSLTGNIPSNRDGKLTFSKRCGCLGRMYKIIKFKMIDRVKFHFDGIRVVDPYGDPVRAGEVVDRWSGHPLLGRITKHWNREYDTPVHVIFLRWEGGTLVSVFAKEGLDSSLVISKIDANIPGLVHGHNGRLVASEEEYLLGFSVLRRVLLDILGEVASERFLGGAARRLAWRVCQLEVPYQFADPDREIVLESHLSGMKYFRGSALMRPGESTGFRSNELKASIYAKDLDIQRKLGCVPQGGSVTRVEVGYGSSRMIGDWLLGGRAVPAVIPFAELGALLRRTLESRITGALANGTKNGGDSRPRGKVAELLRTADSGFPEAFHAELERHASGKKPAGSSKFRANVYGRLAALRPFSLLQCLEEPSRDVALPELERRYAETMRTLGFMPDEPDEEVARLFSRIRTYGEPFEGVVGGGMNGRGTMVPLGAGSRVLGMQEIEKPKEQKRIK